MLNQRRLYYGWFDQGTGMFHLSLQPPDAKSRPSLMFETLADILELTKTRYIRVEWFPPLPKDMVKQELRKIVS
jgi:hypothetical protein